MGRRWGTGIHPFPPFPWNPRHSDTCPLSHTTPSTPEHERMRFTWNAAKACVAKGRIAGNSALVANRKGRIMQQDINRTMEEPDRAMVRAQATHAHEEQTTCPGNELMQVVQIPSLKDNYIYLITDAETGTKGIVDPAESAPVLKHLSGGTEGKVDFIFNTHHHHDHVGGNEELKRKLSCKIIGAEADKHRIPGIDITVREGSTFAFGSQEVRVFETPGHTSGHICYWFPDSKSLFVGDTLFALGCGRLFEGTAEQMWSSLSKLMQLPRDTMVYCAHEYTQANSRFAVHVDGTNEALLNRKNEIDAKRKGGIATVPFLLGEDLDTNPFLRPFDANVRVAMGMSKEDTDAQVFAAIRRSKDVFAG
eukprot:scaffold1060_cov385-Pavlova_lutheri.AAC.2